MAIFLILALLLCVGCVPQTDSFDVHMPNAPIWLWQDFGAAKKFWLERGILFTETDIANIIIEPGEPDNGNLGVFIQTSIVRTHGIIVISNSMEDYSGSVCVMAHELGHAIGMEHTEQGDNLMSPQLAIMPDGSCFWSNLDANEFCRINTVSCQDGLLSVVDVDADTY